jgi:hypothetical protein
MAAKKNLIFGSILFLLTICKIKSDNVETQEEVKEEIGYVPKPDSDAISKISNNYLYFSCYINIFK